MFVILINIDYEKNDKNRLLSELLLVIVTPFCIEIDMRRKKIIVLKEKKRLERKIISKK